MADVFEQLRQQMEAQQMQAFQQQLQTMGGALGGDGGANALMEAMGGAQKRQRVEEDPQAAQLAQLQALMAGGQAQAPAAAASSGGAFQDFSSFTGLAGAHQQLKEETEKEIQKTHKYKNAICEFWQSKRCRKGADCTWAHGEHELQAPAPDPNSAAGVLKGIPMAGQSSGNAPGARDHNCWYFARGWCTRGGMCKFLHDPSKIITHPALGKEMHGPSKEQQTADAVTLLYQQALMQQLQSDPNAYAAALAQAAAGGTAGYDDQTLAAIAQWQQALAAQGGQ